MRKKGWRPLTGLLKRLLLLFYNCVAMELYIMQCMVASTYSRDRHEKMASNFYVPP